MRATRVQKPLVQSSLVQDLLGERAKLLPFQAWAGRPYVLLKPYANQVSSAQNASIGECRPWPESVVHVRIWRQKRDLTRVESIHGRRGTKRSKKLQGKRAVPDGYTNAADHIQGGRPYCLYF